jgi:pimeloyl-ACP methyl ester carboxylesterase
VDIIEQVGRQYSIDRKRVYVAGLSAGASMSAVLAACYPDVFAAAAIHDGTTVPVMVWHGQGDNVVNRDNAELIVRQFIALNDLADDGATGLRNSRPARKPGQLMAVTATRSLAMDTEDAPWWSTTKWPRWATPGAAARTISCSAMQRAGRQPVHTELLFSR